ncbi:MAG: riboflavin synthase [Vampirovibrionales bacterium]|nr:riboflavin synthase [Vampirovibrionales bacterium]
MFTGLIEALGQIRDITYSVAAGDTARLARFEVTTTSAVLAALKLGDSIAINGACMTVTALTPDSFKFDVSPESLAVTSLGRLALHETVNLEQSLTPQARLGGHFVTGHVDGLATLTQVEAQGECFALTLHLDDPTLAKLLVPKGSVALDGISLTVNRVDDLPEGGCRFTAMIIPHTWAHTTLCNRKPGDVLNLETDLLGKYVQRLLQQ